MSNIRNMHSSFSQFPDDENFSGLYEVLWDDGTLRYRGRFLVNLTRVGQHIEFWANGNIREVSYWVDGTICGTALTFYEDGLRENVIDYPEFGADQDSWLSRSYGAGTGDLISMDKMFADRFTRENIWKLKRIKDAFEDIDFEAIANEAVQQFIAATAHLDDEE